MQSVFAVNENYIGATGAGVSEAVYRAIVEVILQWGFFSVFVYLERIMHAVVTDYPLELCSFRTERFLFIFLCTR